jgi:hypothetical protein
VDTISFGSGREPKDWRDWWRRRLQRRMRAWLLVVATAAAVVAAILLVTSHGRAPRTPSLPMPPARPPPTMLVGVPARAVGTDLFLGGENLWRIDRQPRAIHSRLLHNGLSPLLPHGHGAEVDQLAPVSGGVVALISDISTGITYGARGRVLFIPAADAPARVIGRATVIAVAPGGKQVWVQTAIQKLNHGAGAPAGFKSPTWSVNLTGRRVSPVLRLPLGLVGATESGPLTQTLATDRLRLWNGETGQPIHLPLPAAANFVAAGRDRVIWLGSASRLHVTDLRTGTDVVMPLPTRWLPPSGTYPPPAAVFDPPARHLVLLLDRVDVAGNTTAEDLFVADTATGTLRMIPGKPLALPSAAMTLANPLTGSWDRQGLLWVLAANPYTGRYQLGFWTGAGPLQTFASAPGSPVTLSAPGSG